MKPVSVGTINVGTIAGTQYVIEHSTLATDRGVVRTWDAKPARRRSGAPSAGVSRHADGWDLHATTSDGATTILEDAANFAVYGDWLREHFPVSHIELVILLLTYIAVDDAIELLS
jgi:hypothetical protein